MNRTTKLLIGGFTAVALGFAAAFAVAQYRMGTGDHRAGMGFHLGMFCEDRPRADGMLDRIEERLQSTDAQRVIFAEFKAAARSAGDKIRSACQIEWPRNMPERLAMAEKRAEATIEALRIVRPAAEKLYAALSDEQKAKMNGLRRRWGWSHARSDRSGY